MAMASFALCCPVLAGSCCSDITGCVGLPDLALRTVHGRGRQANRTGIVTPIVLESCRKRGQWHRSLGRAQAQSEGKVAEGSEGEAEKEGLAAATVGIVAPELSTAAIDAAVAAAAESSAVGSCPPVEMGWAFLLCTC